AARGDARDPEHNRDDRDATSRDAAHPREHSTGANPRATHREPPDDIVGVRIPSRRKPCGAAERGNSVASLSTHVRESSTDIDRRSARGEGLDDAGGGIGIPRSREPGAGVEGGKLAAWLPTN